MSQQRLTDRSLAPYITGDTLIHIVNTGDTTQYAGGSSYKATIDQVSDYYLNNYDVYITGTTFGSNQSVVTRNDGFDVFKLSGGSNVTLTNPSTNQILIDVAIPPDTNTYVTGGTYNNVTNTITLTRNDAVTINITGVTDTYVTGATLNGNTLELGRNEGQPTLTVDLSSINTNTFVTGGTYSAGTATFTNNTGGTFNVTGFTEPFTGNTSGDCINDIYVKNIHSCSPLNINPLDEGNVYFGSTSGITIDLANNRLGVNTDIPTERLHVEGGDLLVKNTNGKFYTNIQNATGPATLLSGNTTSVSRIGVVVPTYDSVTLGVRGPSAGFPGYGKQGDAFIYSSNANNGFNVISQPGAGTDDYIRFFAGQASGAAGTPDLYIQGSGSTRGYVGINTGVPTERLHVQGNGLFSGELTIETINTGTSVYFLAATSGGTVVQGNDLYSEICSYCSDTFSGETLVATGVTEVDSTNTDNSSFSSTTPYDCTQWCIYNSSGAIVTTTSNYLVARDYGDKGFVVRCCDSNSSDGGTDYGTPITGYTPTPGGGPPITVTGITRPVTVKETKKIAFLNSHRSTILNSNQSSISNSTLGIIDLSTLSFIESSFNSKIYNSYFSGILASENGFVKDSGNATIIGSQYSTLSGVTGSTIIGGNNIVGTENDTVYVPNLNIGTIGGGSPVGNLGFDSSGNVVTGTTGGGGIPEATTATTTNINFTGQTIYYNAGSPGTGNITENLSGAKLGLVQKIYHNDTVEPTYPAGWVLMGDAIYFTSTLNIIYAEWAGGSRVEYWYVQEQ